MKEKTKAMLIGLAGTYAALKLLAYATEEKPSIDDDNAYLNTAVEKEERKPSAYEQWVKPGLDSALSFFGMIALLPVYAAATAAVWLDDPGPILFKQKRVGKDKSFFMMSKFRTMKMSTPHDVPTHLLQNPEQYITRFGRFARRYSIDEACQLWDVFRHRISLVGPRPALWNQADLIAERDKYGANDIMPGITGWAQINGRDELPIEVKARYDGAYAAALKKGGWTAFRMDLRCLLGTFGKVMRHEGVLEGGPDGVREAEKESAGV